MKCEHCGSENNFDWATFCRDCQRPLNTGIVAAAAQNSLEESSLKIDKSVMVTDGPGVDQLDNNEMPPAESTNYPSVSKGPDISPLTNESQDNITPEPIEHELTLYRDESVKVSLAQNASQVLVESMNDDLKITSGLMPVDELSQEVEENQEPKVMQLDPPASENELVAASQPLEPPIHNSTQKIPIPPPTEPVFDQAPEQIEQRPTISSNQVLSEVRQSYGVIYLVGKRLQLTNNIKAAPGDQVKISDKIYVVKKRPARSKSFYIIASAIGAAAILIFLAILTLTSKDIGQLVGTITNANGRPLVGQGVRITELNKTVSTNEAGFFIFNDIPSGIYSIDVQTPGGNRIQDRISVVKNQTTTIALNDRRPEETFQQVEAVPQTATSPASAGQAATGKGTLKLTLSPSSASAYVNDIPMGVGSNSYRLDPGSYTLTIRKTGYQETSQRIRISSDKTLALNFSLAEDVQSQARSGSQTAADLEKSGNFQDAMRGYDQVLKSNPRDVRAMLGKARCARAEGLIDNATTYYLQASKLAADKHDIDLQLTALSGLIDMRPNTYTAYLSRGEILYGLGQYTKAANDYAHVVELDNRNLSAFYKLGDCFYKTGRYSDALSAFIAAQEINFADPKAGVCLAKTYLALGDKKNARKAYMDFKEIASYSVRLEYKRDPEWQKVLTALGEKE